MQMNILDTVETCKYYIRLKCFFLQLLVIWDLYVPTMLNVICNMYILHLLKILISIVMLLCSDIIMKHIICPITLYQRNVSVL